MITNYGSNLGLEYQGKRGPDDIPILLSEHEYEYVGLLPCGRYEDWSVDRRPTIEQEINPVTICISVDRPSFEDVC